jgi:hypothetical protein
MQTPFQPIKAFNEVCRIGTPSANAEERHEQLFTEPYRSVQYADPKSDADAFTEI